MNCYRCGKELFRGTRTREHIPPKCFFSKTDELGGDKLITVYSCTDCNHSHHLADEALRDFLALINSPSPAAQEVVDSKVVRSIRRDRRKLENIRASMSDREMITPGGLYLGDATEIGVQHATVSPVLDSIARGLFYEFEGQPLTQSIGPYIHPSFVHPIPADENLLRLKDRALFVAKVPRVFMAWMVAAVCESGPVLMCWLTFYLVHTFFSLYLLDPSTIHQLKNIPVEPFDRN